MAANIARTYNSNATSTNKRAGGNVISKTIKHQRHLLNNENGVKRQMK